MGLQDERAIVMLINVFMSNFYYVTRWFDGKTSGLKMRREIHPSRSISRVIIALVDCAALKVDEEYGRLVYKNKFSD